MRRSTATRAAWATSSARAGSGTIGAIARRDRLRRCTSSRTSSVAASSPDAARRAKSSRSTSREPSLLARPTAAASKSCARAGPPARAAVTSPASSVSTAAGYASGPPPGLRKGALSEECRSDVVRVDVDVGVVVDLAPALVAGLVLDVGRVVAGAREDALVAQRLRRRTSQPGARGIALAERRDRHPQVAPDPDLVPRLGELADSVALAAAQVERDGAVRRRVAEVQVDLAVADPVTVVQERELEGGEGHIPDGLDR